MAKLNSVMKKAMRHIVKHTKLDAKELMVREKLRKIEADRVAIRHKMKFGR